MTKISITISAVTAIILACLVWWLWPGSLAQAPGGVDSTGTSGGFYRSSVSNSDSSKTSVTEGGSVQPSITTPTIEAAYDDLFKKLLAQKVVFSRVSSASGVEGSVYALFSSDVAAAKVSYPDAKDYGLSIAMIDITDDGISEALVVEDLPGFCGTAGCPFGIYQKSGSAWKLIFSKQIQGEVGLANVINSGHLDLFAAIQGDVDYEGSVVRYVWNEGKYRVKETVASWDGTKFVVYGQ